MPDSPLWACKPVLVRSRKRSAVQNPQVRNPCCAIKLFGAMLILFIKAVALKIIFVIYFVIV